jgi:hypothetical protein
MTGCRTAGGAVQPIGEEVVSDESTSGEAGCVVSGTTLNPNRVCCDLLGRFSASPSGIGPA